MNNFAHERLKRMCAAAGVSASVALGVLTDTLREFPHEHQVKAIAGGSFDRLSYARHLARNRGPEALEQVVWNYLVD